MKKKRKRICRSVGCGGETCNGWVCAEKWPCELWSVRQGTVGCPAVSPSFNDGHSSTARQLPLVARGFNWIGRDWMSCSVCVCVCEVVKCVHARAHMWTFIGKHYYLWLYEWHRLNFSSNKVRHNNILLSLNLFSFLFFFFHYLKLHFP